MKKNNMMWTIFRAHIILDNKILIKPVSFICIQCSDLHNIIIKIIYCTI